MAGTMGVSSWDTRLLENRSHSSSGATDHCAHGTIATPEEIFALTRCGAYRFW